MTQRLAARIDDLGAGDPDLSLSYMLMVQQSPKRLQPRFFFRGQN